MKKNIFLLIASLLQACAHVPAVSKYSAISSGGIAGLRDKSIHVKANVTPDLIQTTGGDQATMTVGMLFGAIGGGIGAAIAISHAKSRGHALVIEDEIPDPTPLLKERVQAMMLSRYGSSIGDSGYELDVATDGWALSKDTFAFNASVKLTDGAATDPTVFASGECKYNSQTESPPPTLDQLLENRAEKLKELLGKAIDQCVHDLDQKVFISS